VWALVRANWLAAMSYRLETFFSFVGIFAAILPLWYISRALQPMMAGVIRTQAPEYFGFLMIGLIAYGFATTAVGSVHESLSKEISTGSFEALMSTPTSLPTLIAGMTGQAFSMAILRGLVVFAASWAFGTHVVWSAGPMALMILVLITFTYLAFGILSAALVLGFRTTGPFPTAIVSLSALLGGVYYPTEVIPSWLASLSAFVPLTYGLRALRRSLLDGASVAQLSSDVAILAASCAGLLLISMAAFMWALRFAKRSGTLAQY
jgi:ABC-type multidrug transport system permease subunit